MRMKRREATRQNHVTATIDTKRKGKHRVSKGSSVPVPSGPLNSRKQNTPLAAQTKLPEAMPPTSVATNQGKPPTATRRDTVEVKAGRKQIEKRSSSFVGLGSISPSKQTKRQTAQTSKARNRLQIAEAPRSSPSTDKIPHKQVFRRKGSAGLHQPSDRELASRPDNRLCIHCHGYVHKDRLSDHLKKKHGMSAQDVELAVAAANPKPTDQTLLKRQISPPMRIAGKTEPKRKVETPYARKRREMKEAFRDIDRLNFPPGARLTSNLSGRLPRGGGFMSSKTR